LSFSLKPSIKGEKYQHLVQQSPVATNTTACNNIATSESSNRITANFTHWP